MGLQIYGWVDDIFNFCIQFTLRLFPLWQLLGDAADPFHLLFSLQYALNRGHGDIQGFRDLPGANFSLFVEMHFRRGIEKCATGRIDDENAGGYLARTTAYGCAWGSHRKRRLKGC